MYIKRLTNWYVSPLLFAVVALSACQKEQTAATAEQKKAVATAVDSAITASTTTNFLASGGTLTLKLEDSTYTFDAAQDSIAFVNISTGDNRYFGITAVNKAHTMSFAISSKGSATANVARGVEGSQLLLRPDALHIKQYSLTQFTDPGDAGVLDLQKYRQDSTLARGTFFTFLAHDDKAESPFYRAEGTFSLKFKTP